MYFFHSEIDWIRERINKIKIFPFFIKLTFSLDVLLFIILFVIGVDDGLLSFTTNFMFFYIVLRTCLFFIELGVNLHRHFQYQKYRKAYGNYIANDFDDSLAYWFPFLYILLFYNLDYHYEHFLTSDLTSIDPCVYLFFFLCSFVHMLICHFSCYVKSRKEIQYLPYLYYFNEWFELNSKMVLFQFQVSKDVRHVISMDDYDMDKRVIYAFFNAILDSEDEIRKHLIKMNLWQDVENELRQAEKMIRAGFKHIIDENSAFIHVFKAFYKVNEVGIQIFNVVKTHYEIEEKSNFNRIKVYMDYLEEQIAIFTKTQKEYDSFYMKNTHLFKEKEFGKLENEIQNKIQQIKEFKNKFKKKFKDTNKNDTEQMANLLIQIKQHYKQNENALNSYKKEIDELKETIKNRIQNS